MSFIILVKIFLYEEDCQALQKEPFRNICAWGSTFVYPNEKAGQLTEKKNRAMPLSLLNIIAIKLKFD